jgi:hypothetical protein
LQSWYGGQTHVAPELDELELDEPPTPDELVLELPDVLDDDEPPAPAPDELVLELPDVLDDELLASPDELDPDVLDDPPAPPLPDVLDELAPKRSPSPPQPAKPTRTTKDSQRIVPLQSSVWIKHAKRSLRRTG